MATITVNWAELAGRQLETTTGVPFQVVRVSATHVAVRPRGGQRDYALSISRELEPAVAAFAQKRLPAPGDLRHLGIRPVLTSYAWGILKAVVEDRIGVRMVKRAKLKDFAGTWLITGMDDMGEDDWADEPETPFVRLQVPRGGSGLSGDYVIGLASGRIEGDLREFGGETIIVFGYDGVDEMEPSTGGGWLKLFESDTLEGEFMGALGRFRATRQRPQPSTAKTVRRPHRLTLRKP